MPQQLIAQAESNRERHAIVDPDGTATYGDLVERSGRVASGLLGGRESLGGARVAYLVAPGCDHVALLWGIWRAGGVAVPLALSHPAPELRRLIDDADPELVVGDAAHAGRLAEATEIPVTRVDHVVESQSGVLPHVGPDEPGLMVYTSGTTGRPKGVVSTHAQIRAQWDALAEAWGWTPDDRILHVLPLHHVHGLQVALGCALHVGACCEFMAAFDAPAVWDRFAHNSVFMAVPTIYRRLVAAWDADEARHEEWAAGARQMRLMTSGSAALPVDLLERWESITGQRLLERYGMTEIGMALSNPLGGDRRPGTVGQALPGVRVRLVNEEGEDCRAGEQGQLLVRGPQVFAEYWRREDETTSSFRDGWFLTGDEALLEGDYFRIVGRSSVDIIKTGGYKVSALEIEEVLRGHSSVAEIAVVGVPDTEWGERVCAAVEPSPGDAAVAPDDLRAWAREQLAPYKVPKQIHYVEALPRNAMGKVVKPEVRRLFEDAS